MFARRRFLRLYFSSCNPAIFRNKRWITSAQLNEFEGKGESVKVDIRLQAKIEKLKEKILYNTWIHGTNENYVMNKMIDHHILNKQRREKLQQMFKEPIPVSLSYMEGVNIDIEKEQTRNDPVVEEKRLFRLPFKYQKSYCIDESEKDANREKANKWMTHYDVFDDKKLESNAYKRIQKEQRAKNISEWNYGIPDPNIPPSNVPCSGCGAVLHCIDTTIPGYLPSEIFKGLRFQELKTLVCQRCHFLKEFNVALNVNVSPEEYPKILSQIRMKKVKVVLMVDLLDFPNSIWPEIMETIGPKKSVILVGNKVDMLPQDQKGYLNHIRDCLIAEVRKKLNSVRIVDTILISARTGFGVEDLITALHSMWQSSPGDTCIVGCTNVGKSTLFNDLIQSDFCKSTASELLMRATVSQWPGTTLNLLKFPIFRMNEERLSVRMKRLHQDAQMLKSEKELKASLYQKDYVNPTMIGYIGRTFLDEENMRSVEGSAFSYNMRTGFTRSGPAMGINEDSQLYGESRWCYDTPGVVQPDQILSILTIDELKLTLPKAMLKPRTYYMYCGTTLLLAGLGRLDYVKGDKPACFTVFAAETLPVTICDIGDADRIYSEFLGTVVLGVPLGDKDRMEHWPRLESGDEITIVGEDRNVSSADVTLSSAGWVAISGIKDFKYTVVPWTPERRGINLRIPALLPYAVKLKGKRMRGLPAYNMAHKIGQI